MATVRPATSSTGDETAQAVQRALDDLIEDYGRYCLGEDADPEGYVERIRGLLEDLKAGTNHDPVAAAAYSAFLEQAAIEEDEGKG